MAKEYIAPRPVDFEWADSLVIGMPERTDASCPELTAYFDALRDLQSGGKLHGKAIAALTTGPTGTGPGSAALAALYSGLAGLDLIVVPPDLTDKANAVDRARLQGRRVAEVARALKRVGI
jgi:NAD(P)H-dependent FMN reductase